MLAKVIMDSLVELKTYTVIIPVAKGGLWIAMIFNQHYIL